MNFNATLNLFANMGENIGKISNELKLVYTDISWSEIKGFRNRVVHDYINIDTFMVLKSSKFSPKNPIEISQISLDNDIRHVSFQTYQIPAVDNLGFSTKSHNN